MYAHVCVSASKRKNMCVLALMPFPIYRGVQMPDTPSNISSPLNRRPIFVLLACCVIYLSNINTQQETTSCSPAGKQVVFTNIYTRYVRARTDSFFNISWWTDGRLPKILGHG